MIFPTQDTLSLEDTNKGLRNITIDGYISQIMVVLTTGPFLVAFALGLGASNLIIGILAALPPLTHLFQIPAIYLIEKYRVRRSITVFSLILYRLCLLLTALIPFFISFEIGLIFLILFMSFQSIFASIGHTAWSFWMHDFIPKEILGSFFSKRIFLSTTIAMLASLIAGYFVDFWKLLTLYHELYAYSILFIFGFIFGNISIFFISKIPEPTMTVLKSKLKFIQMLSEPFKDKQYKNLLIFLSIWSFAINLATPFFTVYLLKKLQFNISLVVILTIISQLTNLSFLKLWGRISDKFSNKSVLALCCPLFIISILAWVFTTLPNQYFLTIPLLFLIHIFSGISMAGIILAIGNISLKLAPKGKANWYLAITSVLTSISLAIAPILGGLFADFFEMFAFSWTLNWTSPDGDLTFTILHIQGFDFFFIIAFFIGIFSLYRLHLIKEEGEVKNKIVLNEVLYAIRRTMKNLSTSGGFQRLIMVPFSFVRRYNNKGEHKIKIKKTENQNH